MVKLSTAIMNVAISGFRDQQQIPSESEAQYALFLAHIAWNAANGEPPTHQWTEDLRSHLNVSGGSL